MILTTDDFLILNFVFICDKVEALALSPDGTLLATGARDKDIILSSLDVSLTEVDALPIEDQSEAAINKGATLWKKYTKKVMQKIMSKYK